MIDSSSDIKKGEEINVIVVMEEINLSIEEVTGIYNFSKKVEKKNSPGEQVYVAEEIATGNAK